MPYANYEDKLAQVRRWRLANPEKYKASVKKCKAKHRDAIRQASREYEASHREQIREKQRKWRSLPEVKQRMRDQKLALYEKNGPLKPKLGCLNRMRYMAKAKGLEFDLTLDNLDWPTHCPVLGIPINYGRPKSGHKSFDGPSIDRTDPSKGYIHTNCRVMSWRANRIKTDASLEEVRQLFAYLLLTRSN